MIRIEIKSTEVNVRSGNNARGPWQIRTQPAFAYTVDRNGKPYEYPERISLQLDDDQHPYAIGNYTLAPQSLYVAEYGRLNLGRPQLTPIQAKPVQAAA